VPYELFDLTVDEVSGVDEAANLRTFLVIKRHEVATPQDHPEPDGDEQPPADYASRLRQRDLWRCLYDKWELFCATLWDIVGDADDDNVPHLPLLVDSIGQFQADVQALLEECGVLKRALPLLEDLTKIGAVMSTERRHRLRTAIAALQGLLDEACQLADPQQGDTSMADHSPASGSPATLPATVQGAAAEALALTKRAETAEAQVSALTARVAEADRALHAQAEELARAESALAKARQTPEEQEAEYLESLPPVIRKKREAEQLEIIELRKEATANKERAEQAEYVAKARTLAGVGFTPNHWRCLKALDVLATCGYEEERTELLRLLNAAQEHTRTESSLYTALGTSGAGVGILGGGGSGSPDAEGQILGLAKAYAEEKGVPLGKAIEAIARAHPDLWERNQREKRKNNRVNT
jgi:hypothetical protein